MLYEVITSISSFEDALQILIDDMDYLNASDRGYLTVRFTPSIVDAQWNFVSSVFAENYTEITERTESYSL